MIVQTLRELFRPSNRPKPVPKSTKPAQAPSRRRANRPSPRSNRSTQSGVVVAVRGEIIWAEIFSDTNLLARYWSKLVRSYAAEVLSTEGRHDAATIDDAQRFLDVPMRGTEKSEGEVGVYRYREVKTGPTDQFALESLLPGTEYDVHISRLKIKGIRSSLY